MLYGVRMALKLIFCISTYMHTVKSMFKHLRLIFMTSFKPLKIFVAR
jgi:hypothetical protein